MEVTVPMRGAQDGNVFTKRHRGARLEAVVHEERRREEVPAFVEEQGYKGTKQRWRETGRLKGVK